MMKRKSVILILAVFSLFFLTNFVSAIWPAPFINNGQADVAIVFGNSAPSDDSRASSILKNSLNSQKTSGTIGEFTDIGIDGCKDKNLIILGNSCFNPISASLLGSSTPLCGESFTSKTGAGPGQYFIAVYQSPYNPQKIAMLIAGYDTADTIAAITKVKEGTISTDIGTKIVGSTSEPSCTPNCNGKQCGDNGCGGSCGSCSSGQVCSSGTCISSCTPNCNGKQCGSNGCGGSCGSCSSSQTCNSASQCISSCTPNCAGKICGDNGCGGSCGSCSSGQVCSSGACSSTTLPLTGNSITSSTLTCWYKKDSICGSREYTGVTSCSQIGSPLGFYNGMPLYGSLSSCNSGIECTNECGTLGAKDCSGQYIKNECGQFDSDICLDAKTLDCSLSGQVCSSGACIEPPTNNKNEIPKENLNEGNKNIIIIAGLIIFLLVISLIYLVSRLNKEKRAHLKKVCENCNKEFENDDGFCDKCGSKLKVHKK